MNQPNFPPINNLERGDNGDIILGGSIALNRILIGLRETTHNTQPKEVWLVNIYTLLENVYDPKLTLSQMRSLIENDIELLCLYIEAHITSTNKSVIPNIIFYLPSYDTIPKNRRRIFSNDTKSDRNMNHLNTIYNQLKQVLYTPKLTITARSQMWSHSAYVSVGGSMLPHRDLISLVKSFRDKNIYLITHCPMDYHLFRYVRNLTLVERYTGELLKLKGLAKKIDKKERIPFNIITHQVFGDKIHLAPLVTRGERIRLYRLAGENKWILKTESEIFKDLISIVDIKRQQLLNIL